MDASLRKEKEAFKKRALAQPTVEARPKKAPASESSKSKPAKRSKVETSKPREMDYKAVSGVSDNRFAVLAKVVTFLKEKHHQGVTEGILLDDILDENQLVISARLKHWLATEALVNNPKVEVINNELYKFKPIYNIRDRKGLLSLLMKSDQKGMGGILAENVQESLPNYAKAMKQLGDQVTIIMRPADKKLILFYNDKNLAYNVDEEIQKMWRSVTVEGIDERKIEEYLQKHDIVAMKDLGLGKVAAHRRKKPTSRKPRAYKSHNDHLGNLLEDYTDKK